MRVKHTTEKGLDTLIVVKYSPEGEAVSDFKVKELVKEVINQQVRLGNEYGCFVEVSSENVIYALRVYIAKGIIQPSDVKLLFGETRIEMDKYGTFLNAPLEFCRTQSTLLDESLMAALDREEVYLERKIS